MAGNRSITVTLRANVADFKNQFDAATKAAEQTTKATEDAAKRSDTAMGRMVQSAQDNRQAWDTAGATLTGFGAAALGGLGLATKAAMDWESSWAGVQKTVDGTAPQMAELEQGLRGLARELPASHQEIAAVAEAAGQLGIATPNVLGFTRTMIDMGEATNLSAEEAATSLARFMNVMGTSQGDVGRLGASVVGLGNNFATTESEIVAMAQRLSGAGAQAGLTEGDVLGMAAAMSSVGIEAEAGGSAMSQTMKRIGKAVDEGGASLDLFAQVSGMTAEQFSSAWNDNPAMALDGFINGLSGVEEQGMTTNGVLAELGITGIRESDSLLRLSAAAGQGADGMSLLASATQMGNEEFDKGSALIEEASKRYETAESRIAIAKNALVDAGISIGSVVLPAFADLADGVADAAGWLADLPGPVHEVVAGLGGIAGAGSLAAGGFLLVFPRVMDVVGAFKALKTDMPGVAGGLGKVGKAAGIAGLALVGLQVAGQVAEMFSETALSADEMSAKLLNLAGTADIAASDIDGMVAITGTGGAQVKDFGYALESVNMNGFMKGLDSVGSLFGTFDSDVSLAKEQIASLDQALSTFATAGATDQLADAFGAMVESAAEYGYTAEDIVEQMPGLQTALAPVATELGLTADNATIAKIALGEIAPPAGDAAGAMGDVEGAAGEMGAGIDAATGEVEEQVDALAELQDLLQGTSDLMLGVRGSARSFEEAMDAASAAVEENGKTLDITTEAGRANEAALDGIASATQDWANSAEEAGASAEELDGIMSSGREAFIESAVAMGMSKDEASALADELQLIPSFVETEVAVNVQTAIDAASQVGAVLQGIMDADPATVPVDANTDQAEMQFDGLVSDVPPATMDVGANVTPAQSQVDGLAAAVDAAGGTITVNGNTVPANSSLSTIMGIINSSDGTVTIDGTTYPADQALGVAIAAINRSGGTVDIDGNNSGAIGATNSAVGHANSSSGSIDVNANTGSANSSINYAARNRTSTITVRYSDPGFKGGGGSGRFASGGAVHGPGTGTSDSIDAKLSNNEHVWTANEVGVAGGHQAIYSLRQQILAGAKTLHLATGGGVENGSVAPVQYAPVYRQAGAQSGPAAVDSSGIPAAVREGMRGMTVALNMDGRTLYGAVVDAGKSQRAPFVTRRG